MLLSELRTAVDDALSYLANHLAYLSRFFLWLSSHSGVFGPIRGHLVKENAREGHPVRRE